MCVIVSVSGFRALVMTAIASLANPEILPIDQNTARFYNRVAFDMDYGGMANTSEEGDRLGRLLGNKQMMMMGNHGMLVCADTVAAIRAAARTNAFQTDFMIASYPFFAAAGARVTRMLPRMPAW